MVYEQYPHITPSLPSDITFIHAEELLATYPELSPRERESEAAKKFGAIFVIGIGGKLSNGEKHDGRAPDYDDWSTSNSDGFEGLNGDIILWNDVLDCAFELSSMGIRVDKEALARQLEICGCPERSELNSIKHYWKTNCLPRSGVVSDRAASACFSSAKPISAKCRHRSGRRNKSKFAGNTI